MLDSFKPHVWLAEDEKQREFPVRPLAPGGLSGPRRPGPAAAGGGGGPAGRRLSAAGEGCALPPERLLRRLLPEENLQRGWAELPGARWHAGDDAQSRGGGCGPRAAGGRRGAGQPSAAPSLDWTAPAAAPVLVHATSTRIRLGHRQFLHLTFDTPSLQIQIQFVKR